MAEAEGYRIDEVRSIWVAIPAPPTSSDASSPHPQGRIEGKERKRSVSPSGEMMEVEQQSCNKTMLELMQKLQQ